MTLHKPVMIEVDFMPGTTYNNDDTTEHFVVIVGTGTENGKKYYRFSMWVPQMLPKALTLNSGFITIVLRSLLKEKACYAPTLLPK